MFIFRVNADISLKLLEPRDADVIFGLVERSRTHLREWLPWVDATTSVEDIKSWIKDCLLGYAENGTVTAVILYRGQAAGVIGFNQLNWQNKFAAIGYWLGETFQGQGIMTTACRGILNYAFNELNLTRVDIRAAEKNSKSRSIPERLGFTLEGKLRKAEWLNDHYVDHIVYGMLAEEWN